MKYTTNVLIAIFILAGCTSKKAEESVYSEYTYPDIKIAAAMKDAVWEGELYSKIDLDTISEKKGLYGLGPLTYMRGEITIVDGDIWVSRVDSTDSASVKREDSVSAPFLVYTNVTDWDTIALPNTVTDIAAIQEFIDKKTVNYKRPFAFKLQGDITSATIHIQNLPPGSTVSNPKEAHAGQKKYTLEKTAAEIIGFFSTEHQRVFTHHDSYMHLHLITNDKKFMGHLDGVKIETMNVLLPKK